MKIYLAGSCSSENRTTMVGIAKQLRAKGLEVYCPWELQIENAWDYPQEEWAQKVFEADIAAIENCDIVLMISLGRMSSAGVNWENGYAYARGKIIYVIQITDAPTSLMTFCGSTHFYNTIPAKLYEKIEWIGSCLAKGEEPVRYNTCRTVLT
jgi:nucleoside 2-deoxyribosyltransferase